MKRFFLRGLTALLPTILTLWVVVAVIGFVVDHVASPVTRAIHWCLVTNQIGKRILESTTPVRIYDRAWVQRAALPPGVTVRQAIAEAEQQSSFILDLHIVDRALLYEELRRRIPPVFGLAVGFVLIFMLGIVLRGYLGRYVFHRAEKLFFSFPLVRRIYPYAKKLVEFFFQDKSTVREFQTVVAVPYPSKGMFALGFVTSDGLRSLNDRKQGEFVCVYLPSSPTPMTGWVVFIPKDDVVPLSLTLDQAMGLIISGGVIVPEHELIDPHDKERILGGPSVDEMPSLRRRAEVTKVVDSELKDER